MVVVRTFRFFFFFVLVFFSHSSYLVFLASFSASYSDVLSLSLSLSHSDSLIFCLTKSFHLFLCMCSQKIYRPCPWETSHRPSGTASIQVTCTSIPRTLGIPITHSIITGESPIWIKPIDAYTYAFSMTNGSFLFERESSPLYDWLNCFSL